MIFSLFTSAPALFGFGVLNLWQSLNASHFWPLAVSFFRTPNQRIQPDERSYLTCSGANKGLQPCVLQLGYSDCLDSAGTLCQCPCFDRRRESHLCSVEHFAEPGFGFCFPCHLGRNTCSLASALAHGRRYTPSFRETRESRTCCPHGKTGPSGR